MALRAVPDHPKFADLKRRLGLTKGETLGYLECVWHFAGRFTPQGNIGKYSDIAIEAWCEWDGEAGSLISAMVESRWLDRDINHRILIHDWPTHADKAAKQALTRAKLDFCFPTVDTGRTQSIDLRALPVPESLPESESESESHTLALAAPPVRAVVEIVRSIIRPIPETAEVQIRGLADQAPDQQDHETGVRLAVQELVSSANPETTLAAMLDNIPLWWVAMREGRARIKPLRFVIADRDYLRRPREPTKSKRETEREQLSRQPNPRLQPRPHA